MQLVSSIQHYMQMELDLEIGELGGENVLDFMLKELAPYMYNQALEDARGVVRQRMESIEEDLYALQKPASASRR